MKCRICGNGNNNTSYEAKEMFLGLREKFTYFQCSICECLQIKEIPGDMSEYYPYSYYSFIEEIPTQYFQKSSNPLIIKLKSLRNDYAIFNKGTIGKLVYMLFPAEFVINTIKLYFSSVGLNKLVSKNSRILDVGCGRGKLLHLLKEYGFNNSLGIDPFIDCDIEYSNGLRILKKHLVELEETFDLIMFHHSFEHIPNQIETITKISHLLSDNGTCLIRVPTVSSYAWGYYRENWIALDPPRHFYLHSLKSINILAEKGNFKIEKVVYDSTLQQFAGSEAYCEDIPLASIKFNFKNLFNQQELNKFTVQSVKLNAEDRGDTAAFYLKKQK